MIIHSLLSLNNITVFVLHVRDDFEFSASTTEFGPSGQVTNDVTLSMDMTSDTKVNIPFGPKQSWRRQHHFQYHDGRFNDVGVGRRCWLSIYPPDSFQTLGLYLLLTELGSSSGRTVGLTLFGMGAKRPPRGKSRAPRWKEHRANPPKLIGICIKKYHHYTIVSKLLFKKISSIFSKTMLYRFTTEYSTWLANIFVYAYFRKVVEAWR